MSNQQSRRNAVDSPENHSPSSHRARPRSGANQQDNSPFRAPGPRRADVDVEASPWSASSSGTSYESLTLPPIIPGHHFNRLPAFEYDDPFFDAHSPPVDQPAPNTPPRADSLPNGQSLPPSHQQQARPASPVSPYGRSDSSDLWGSLDDLEVVHLSTQIEDTLGEDMPGRSTRHSSYIDLTESSPVAQEHMVPTTRTRKRKAATPVEEKAGKIPRTNKAIERGSSAGSAKKEKSDAVAILDLVDVNTMEEYEARKAKDREEMIKQQNQVEATKQVKLAGFQCIICMDNPSDLTVTFCGHLFCSECLHQALHTGEKKCCPVCRSNISLPKPGAGKQPKNGVFVLQMKAMTAKKRGKQAAR